MLNSMKRNGLILAGFAIATTALVAVTNWLTADEIIKQQQLQLQQVLNQVVPKSLHDNELYASCMMLPSQTSVTDNPLPAYLATQNGQASAIAIETYAPDGYNGAIKLIVGLDINGAVLGARVLNHNETPGLGDKIDTRVTDWILSFAGKTLTESNQADWAVRKDGGKFDQFTGATITPRAVVKAVKNTVRYYQTHQDEILRQPRGCQAQ